MRAEKLKAGDEIRVISPAESLSIITAENIEQAVRHLKKFGFEVTFSKHASERDDFDSSAIESRIEDLHAAFLDPRVKGILTAIGGFNSNQLLRDIDYSIIKNNPKRLCGYSDITVLSNAIYAKTGLITYSGPHFSTFAMRYGNDYTLDYFQKLMIEKKDITVGHSEQWSDDLWFLDQENRNYEKNQGPYTINQGEAKGTIIGGNLCTLNLLQGTEYMPSLADSILFLEDDYEVSPATFDRDLQSLIHQSGFEQVNGIVIGRFQKASMMTRNLLTKIIKTKKELAGIPVIADVDFGHTAPLITFPIGGRAKIKAFETVTEIIISEN
ncbi:S66 family peptidase [Paenibacillus wynnii]|uniref:Peptidase S66 n=1 Tax=Paenibacillus wynnii TaxID=268407 RepID=A0A098M444_9BACL|nr:S66 peptidase family protein [Paenibacillus wynnii]KGE16798.1 peptidase S66 [Paenibacillus wynnii]